MTTEYPLTCVAHSASKRALCSTLLGIKASSHILLCTTQFKPSLPSSFRFVMRAPETGAAAPETGDAGGADAAATAADNDHDDGDDDNGAEDDAAAAV